jgi:2,4-dienoyl-CoA reductase (NADPH2)
MGKSGNYRKLLEPFQLKHLTLKNRIVKAPYTSTNSDERGYILDSAVYHYDAVARGGVGLFITESVAVDPMGMSGSPRMAICDDSYIPGQKSLAEVVHKHGTPILMQIHHAGPSYSTGVYGSWSTAEVERLGPRAASSLAKEQLPGPRPNLPRGLMVAEIEDLVRKFTRAAERAGEAGFDGVELHFGGGYLMNSFFSRAWNKRTDEYGGTLESRARFATEIVCSVRDRLGEKFIIGARINGAEFGAEHGDGLTYEESRQIGRILEKAGVDLLQVKDYGYNHFEWVHFPEQGLYPEVPKGTEKFAKAVRRGEPNVAAAESVKKAVSIPVITVGGLSFDSAERVLRQGRADLVAFARALIADPDAPNKLRDGRVKDIRPCTHCMTCVDALIRSEHERCRVNAAFAKEKELQIIPAAKKKKVLVIGGGPSGMEAARVAALRGHAVSVYERHAGLGGLVPLASLIKSAEIEDLPGFITYLERQLDALGVQVKRGHAVDAKLVRELAPDVVVVATGSKLRVPDIPGIESKNVLTNSALQAKVKLPMQFLGPSFLDWATKIWLPVGKRVVLIGGLMQGVELAEFLVKRGRHVVVTDTSDQLGTGMLEIHRMRLLDWLQEKGSTLLDGVTYEKITDEGVSLTTKEGQRRFFEADTVVVLSVREADDSLYEELKGLVAEVHVIGDCNEPGMIVDAVEGGYRAACAV